MPRLAIWIATCAALAGALAAAAQTGTVTVAREMSTRSVRTEESDLAGLIADALRSTRKTDAALFTAICFTEITLPRGTATPDDVVKALVNAEDTIVVVKLTGAQIRKALAHGLSLHPQRSLAFPQVSGLTVEINPTGDAAGRVGKVKVGKSELDESKHYTIAMPAPLANGHLGYSRIWDRDAIDTETDATLGEAVREHLKTLKTIGEKTDERLVVRR
jgi:2',3'-cyclic-nucleotide 2'-phosphodiesterase (5'-nucleotidase family)